MKSTPAASLIIVTLIIVAGAYWYTTSGVGEQPALTTSSSLNALQTRFQVLVSELQPISFNSAIFSDPGFMSLVDITTPVTPETPGRLDPFAPIPGVAEK